MGAAGGAGGDLGARMRDDWDRRAREDSWAAIATGESEGLAFALSGLRDAGHLLHDVYPYLTPGTRVLEIGCGVGRLLRYLALIFPELHGVDVSPEMIRQGREYLARFPHVELRAGDGRTLAGYPDAFFGLVYSYVVFQHIPDPEVVRGYVREAGRVTAPGGIFKFQIKTRPWKGETGALDTWVGASLDPEIVRGWLAAAGFEVLAGYPADERSLWVIARRSGAQ